MRKIIGAAAFAAALALPAAGAAQQAAPARQPSPFAALEVAQELQLTPQQQAAVTAARDSLREAHRIHCGPMHASTPSEADEARHHADMALINARWEDAARGAMTPVQLERLAVLRPAPAAHAEEHDEGEAAHGGHAAPAAGHGGHHPAPAPAAGHGGQHPAPAAAPAAAPAHSHGHPLD
jgi:cellobiose-specific phosphotransferase system component IIA